VLGRLSSLALTGMIRFLRLLAISNADKDIEILVLRHQLTVLQRRVNKPRLTLPDRAFLAALLLKLPRPTLRRLSLIVSPETVLRWHRDLLRHRHPRISPTTRPGRPATVGSIRALVVRLARDNPRWGYRRIHSELAILRIKVTPSTVWEILTTHGIHPAPHRDHLTWTTFLRSQAHALLAADCFDINTLTAARPVVLALIEHATHRLRILGATAHPTAAWTTPRARNLVMDLHDAHATVTYLIQDRDSRYTAAFDAVLADSGITTITTGIRLPRINAIMQRWIRTCRTELLDRTLILNQAHLLHIPREFEAFYHDHRTHRALQAAAPLRPLPPTDHRIGSIEPTHHPTKRSTRRHPPRVPPCCLTSTDEIFGTYNGTGLESVRG